MTTVTARGGPCPGGAGETGGAAVPTPRPGVGSPDMAAITRSRGRLALAGLIALAAIALGIVVVGLAPDADRLPAGGAAVPVLGVAIGWGFVGVGLFAWLRRPENVLGLLICAFGLAVVASLLVIADEPLPYLVSRVADPLAVAVFIHLLLAFPSGRLEGRAARAVVGGGVSAPAASPARIEPVRRAPGRPGLRRVSAEPPARRPPGDRGRGRTSRAAAGRARPQRLRARARRAPPERGRSVRAPRVRAAAADRGGGAGARARCRRSPRTPTWTPTSRRRPS